MKIVVAPDSFKESMTAEQVARAMERGIRNVSSTCEVVRIPLADGGEGTAEVLTHNMEGDFFTKEVTGPLGAPVMARYGMTREQVAIIEIASACGLHNLPRAARNPLSTTTYGVGELIVDALDKGARRFIIGLGGSGTNDGGIGMAQALGAEIIDVTGAPVVFGGEGLTQVAHISVEKMEPRLRDVSFTVASDVTNPLLGKTGGTYVYGPQKGATPDMLVTLEAAMARYAEILQRDVGVDVRDVAGAGAAGGLGAALVAFLQANIERGIELVMGLSGVEDAIRTADLVLTGEGKIDDQTLYGKVPFGVAALAKKYHVPVIAFAGVNHVTERSLYDAGIEAIFSIMDGPMTLAEALERGEELLTKAVENVLRLYVKSGK